MDGPRTIGCSDSVGASAVALTNPLAIHVGPLTFGDLRAAKGAQLQTLNPTSALFAWKAFLIADKATTAGAVRLSIATSGPARAGLAYTTIDNRDLAVGRYVFTANTSLVSIRACATELTGIVGGLVVDRPACVKLQVAVGASRYQATVPIGLTNC